VSEDYRKKGPHPSSELRANPRYRLSRAPEVELLDAESPTPIKTRLINLSRSGCYIEATWLAQLESVVRIILKKGEDEVRAQGRVVRVSPSEGIGLEFLSIEGNGFQILEKWLTTFVATMWVAAARRPTQRVAMEIAVRVSGYNAEGARFTEDTHTIEINPCGGSVKLRTPVHIGQRIVLCNLKTHRIVECIVAHHVGRGTETQVGLAFVKAKPSFWPIVFPSPEGSLRDPEADRYRKP